MQDMTTLTPIHLDALREVANIGAGHAATALSQITGHRIMINVPTINFALLEEIPPQLEADEEPVAAVMMNMIGDLSGRTLLVFPSTTARRLAGLMLRREISQLVDFTELEQSAVKEAGNILSGAYMNALSEFLGLILLPSPPALAIDQSRAVLSTAYLQFSDERDFVFCVESEFIMQGVENERLRGFFLLLPDDASLRAMLRAARVA